MLQAIGILVIVNSLLATGFWIKSGTTDLKSVIALCMIGIFTGLVLAMNESISEVSIGSVGKIKAAAKQATVDAEAVADIRKQIEAQRSTVDLVARDAAEAKKIVEEASFKNKQAEDKLNTL